MKQDAQSANPERDRRKTADHAGVGLVLRRLDRLGPLSEGSRLLIRTAGAVRDHPSGTQILGQGEGPRPLWLAAGWACRQRVLEDGRRQIISFLLPGDSLGFYEGAGLDASSGIAALSTVTVVDGAAVARVLGHPDHAGLAGALRRQAAGGEALLVEQIVRLGRLNALERVTHLLLEFHARLAAVDLVGDHGFELPLTQEVLADAAGLSIVHVNRTLQQLRRDGVVELRGGYARVLRHTVWNGGEHAGTARRIAANAAAKTA